MTLAGAAWTKCTSYTDGPIFTWTSWAPI